MFPDVARSHHAQNRKRFADFDVLIEKIQRRQAVFGLRFKQIQRERAQRLAGANDVRAAGQLGFRSFDFHFKLHFAMALKLAVGGFN